MSLAGTRTGKTALVTAGGLLMIVAGCVWQRPDPDHDLYSAKVSELQPGAYCEIEMNVPPTSPENSSHCYKGTVKELTSEEIVLKDVLEETQIDYAGSNRHREPAQEKHAEVRVPLTGVFEIWALRPKDTAAPPAASGAGPSVPAKLPSQGAHPVMTATEGAARHD
jgi:hypothetical protein